MEYTSVSAQRTSKAKALGMIALAIVGTLVASYAVFNTIPAKTQLVQVDAESGDSDLLQQYTDWKQKHGFNFDPQEDATRAAIWIKSHQIINNHNSKNETYQLGHNHFSHLTQEEFAATSLGFIKRNHSNHSHHGNNSNSSESRLLTTLPTIVNWTSKGAVTPVKNQGQCGSCYTFSSTGALEGLAWLKTGKLYSFSEQQLVDCSANLGNGGCNGGAMETCFEYVINNKGIASEASYPYKAAQQTCNTKAPIAWSGVTGYTEVTAKSPSSLQAAIASAPTSVTVEADKSTFQLYKSGIISGTGCGTNIDHATLGVGYNTQLGFYYVKNSWGTGWGEYGYFRIAITGNDVGTCGIQQWAVTPH